MNQKAQHNTVESYESSSQLIFQHLRSHEEDFLKFRVNCDYTCDAVDAFHDYCVRVDIAHDNLAAIRWSSIWVMLDLPQGRIELQPKVEQHVQDHTEPRHLQLERICSPIP